jgi:hypothetical protein
MPLSFLQQGWLNEGYSFLGGRTIDIGIAVIICRNLQKFSGIVIGDEIP